MMDKETQGVLRNGFGIAGAVIAGVFILGLISLGFNSFFAPRHEEIRRQVYEESWTHVRGKAQHLSRLRMEYEKSDSEAHRAGIRSAVQIEMAGFDKSKLPEDLADWIDSL